MRQIFIILKHQNWSDQYIVKPIEEWCPLAHITIRDCLIGYKLLGKTRLVTGSIGNDTDKFTWKIQHGWYWMQN